MKFDRRFYKYYIIIAVSLGIISYTAYKIITYQEKPVVETPQSEMKEIPTEIKKELIQQTAGATTSAILRVPILMYHYVEYIKDRRDTIRQSLDVNPNIFEKQIQTLVSANYTFMTAKELGQVIDGQRQLSKNPILLTFDDGHWDFDTVILPILKKYQVKATIYIIPGFLGKPDFLSNKQLQDIIDSGLVDIGAHTVHHISLKGKKLAVVTQEIDQSKTMLEDKFHLSVVSFAYPNGAFDQQAIGVVKEAGLTTAVSTVPGIMQTEQNRFFLYRLRPGGRTGRVLLNFLARDSFKK